MSLSVCLCANTIYYPEGGGHLWVYLNWALGLRALDCRVIWLELVASDTPALEIQKNLTALKTRLEPYGLGDLVALCSWTHEPLSSDATIGCLDLEAATDVDLLLNIQYDLLPEVVKRFRRSVFLDIDPGLLQMWVNKGQVRLASHDRYFTIGETVGRPGAGFPDLRLKWRYIPPCVALDWWPPCRTPEGAAFTTVAHWYASSCIEDGAGWDNKRTGFQPFLDLPHRTKLPLELALNLGAEDEEEVAKEEASLKDHGWRVRHAHTVASTPSEYQRYIQNSLGEFSCAKPSCIRLQNAWISDRTICYLASGKPAVVQHTGPSRFLPDSAGLFRFRDPDDALRCLDTVMVDYDKQCRLARELAETHFDAKKVVTRMLEQAIT